jgi:hypothetical protein
LGTRIRAEDAERDLSNYLTDTIRSVVRTELRSERTRAEGKVFSAPRIYDDLLSSQPLCFNLFGELKADLSLATKWARHLWPDRVKAVRTIELEHSPGGANARYLDNGSAFDVYLEHSVPGGGEGFIGFAVKYDESLEVQPARMHERIEKVAKASGVFRADSLPKLGRSPLQQIWFDHLLALSMLQADGRRWGENGLFVVLHPVANEACYRVLNEYEATLADHRTFQRMTLEEAVTALAITTSAPLGARVSRAIPENVLSIANAVPFETNGELGHYTAYFVASTELARAR